MTPEQIAAAIRASRAEFGRVFWKAQAPSVPDPTKRATFDAVGTAGADQDAFLQAVRFAYLDGWLPDLERTLAEERLENGQIVRGLLTRSAVSSGNAALQQMINNDVGFYDPDVAARGLTGGMRWTAKILIDGQAKGTGSLVGPHLVLTAWHVVASLFDDVANQGWTVRAGTASRLQIQFDDLLIQVANGPTLAPAPPVLVRAADDWCVAFSPCHIDERQADAVFDLSDGDGHWDYAVIRLSQTPGAERRWLALDAVPVPRAKSDVFVFAHPGGQQLRLSSGPIVDADPPSEAVPRVRFLHQANAVNGSSGAPCFDRSFVLFGLHQGAWNRNGQIANRGVPILAIRNHIFSVVPELPVPDASESPIWRLGAAALASETSTPVYDAVVACDDFQQTIWKAALRREPRIIVISGEDRSGKTFRVGVLTALLPDDEHLKIVLNAPTFSKLDATALVAMICREAGAEVPVLATRQESATAEATWVRDEVLHRLMQALETVRRGRRIWLVLTELNKTTIQGQAASELLIALYERTRSTDWLRVILDGLVGDLPLSVRTLTERSWTSVVTIDELHTFLRRAIVATSAVPDEGVIKGVAIAAHQDYEEVLGKERKQAWEQLGPRAMKALHQYFLATRSGGHQP